MQKERWPARGAARGTRGQSTVEYALIVFAFMSMALAMAVVWHAGRDGALLRLAIDASSHNTGGTEALEAINDILLF